MASQTFIKNLFTAVLKVSFIILLFISATPVSAQKTVTKEVLVEQFAGSVLPEGWTTNSYRNFKWQVAPEAAAEGSVLNLKITNGNAKGIKVAAFTSAVHMYPEAKYSISFKLRNKLPGSASFKLLLNSGQHDIGATTVSSSTIGYKNEWGTYTYNVPLTGVITEGKYHVGISVTQTDGDLDISLDELKVTATFEIKEYYNNSLENLVSLVGWGTNKNGSGAFPLNFKAPYQYFYIENYSANAVFQLPNMLSLAGEGSKIILGNGSTPVTLRLTNSRSLEAGVIDLNDYATLAIDVQKSPNLGTVSPLSTIIFERNAPAEILEGTEFGTVVFNSSKYNRLTKNIRIKGNLELMDAKLELGDYNLEMAYETSILNGSDNSYLVVSGKGRLRKGIRAGSGDVVLPVGNSTYNPVKINLAAGSQDDIFSVGVLDGVYGSYTNDVPELTSSLTDKTLNRTWIISEDVKGGSDITLTLSWNAADALTGFDAANCHIKHYEYGAWDETVSTKATVSGTTYSVSRSGITSFSPYTVSSRETQLTPMPVELLHFAAKATPANTVELTWATAMERDSDYFAIERSTDGKKFTEIARINSAGTTSTRTNYSYTDNSTVSGTVYYRLRQVDKNGSFEFMPVRMVNLKSVQQSALSLYPNPAQGNDVNLRVQGLAQGEEAMLLVTDMMGRNVQQQRLQAGVAVLSTRNLKAGTYLVSVVSQAGSLTQKLLIR